VLGLVQEGGGEPAIGAAVEVDHIFHIAAGIAVDEQSACRTGLRAAPRILGKLRARRAEAQWDWKTVAEANTQRPEIAALTAAAWALRVIAKGVERALAAIPAAAT
jgi:hypothetical protein